MSVYCSFITLPVVPEIEISDHDISIWLGKTADLSSSYYPFYSLLGKAELAAAARFQQEDHKKSYVIRHAVLRLLLGRRLNMPAMALEFCFNQNNKPYLKVAGEQSCFFNLSHSAGGFMIAISNDELGVDIERVSPAFEWQDIAEKYFSTAEAQYISTAPNPTEAFFLLWTRKEALLKACGMGINDNLPDIPALDGRHYLPSHYPEKDWQTESFTFNHNFVGSITYSSPAKPLMFMQIDVVLAQALLEMPE